MEDMDTESERRIAQTPAGVISGAWIIGVLGALGGGTWGLVYVGFGGRINDCGVIVILDWIVGGGAAGAGIVGLFSLFFGAKLGRGFSCAFCICISSFIAAISSRWWFNVDAQEEAIMVFWFVLIVVIGVGGGVALTKSNCRYDQRARLWAFVGTALMLLFIVCSLPNAHGQYSALDLASMAFVSILFGGSLGAVAAAIQGRRV